MGVINVVTLETEEIVVPVFKKGKRYDRTNYRPISLTCVASKLMEHIISSCIMSHASQHNLLYPLQHGFRNACSCETQLLEFVHDVPKICKPSNRLTYVCWISQKFLISWAP